VSRRARRHHRYIFEEKQAPVKGAKKKSGEEEEGARVGARLQELGPRFTLKLRSLQVPGSILHAA
jgi:ribosome production factor 1